MGTLTGEQAKELIVAELAKARRGPDFCRGPGSGVYHGVASAHPLLLPEFHETICGWQFGVIPEVTRWDLPPDHLQHRVGRLLKQVEPCKKCWRELAVAPEAGGAG